MSNKKIETNFESFLIQNGCVIQKLAASQLKPSEVSSTIKLIYEAGYLDSCEETFSQYEQT